MPCERLPCAREHPWLASLDVDFDEVDSVEPDVTEDVVQPPHLDLFEARSAHVRVDDGSANRVLPFVAVLRDGERSRAARFSRRCLHSCDMWQIIQFDVRGQAYELS